MRIVAPNWQALETARQQKAALLFHIWVARDAYSSGATAGRNVTPPVGWGSWCYSTGFQGNVDFTDVANYAQDWQLANSGSPIRRTYAPAAIGFDPSQVFRKEDTSLDPHDLTLAVDPGIDPFTNYVNRNWPLVFGITIYKVHRAGASSIATTTDANGNAITPADVLFVGYLHADDTLELNSAGLELSIDAATNPAQGAKAKLQTQWDHVFKKLDRKVPRPVVSVDCPKMVYGTGFGAAVDCNADMPSNLVSGTVTEMNGVIISAVEWGAMPNGWFAQGTIIYDGIDPVSGLDFTFQFDVDGSSQRGTGPTYGDLQIGGCLAPPLLALGTVVQAYKGCNRQRNDGTTNSCMIGFVPAGTPAAVPGTFTPGTLRVGLELLQTPQGSGEQNPVAALVYITATQIWIVYNRDNSNQIGNIVIGTANGGAGTPFDSSSSPALAWTAVGSTIKSNQFPLANASASGPPVPSVPNSYHLTIGNNDAVASIQQQPNANNGYTAIIKCPGGSPGNFDFTIDWIANTGTPIATGNLQNFGGSDAPIEHPTLGGGNE